MINDLDTFLKNTDKKRVLFLTGAGLSKESGISTFRDAADGLWMTHKIDQVCNISTFYRNYELVHQFYNSRRVALKDIQPNAGHDMIAHFQNKYPDQVLHISANVDDLVERAGGAAMHVHGDITKIVENWGEDNETVVDVGYSEYVPVQNCIAKPAVVFFGECFRYVDGKKLPIYDEMFSALQSLNSNDAVIIIGSSDTVIPWSHYISAKQSIKINVNPELSSNSDAFDYNVTKPVTEAVSEISTFIESHMNKAV